VFAVYAGTGEDEVEELVPVLCDEVMKITRGIDEKEMQRAKAQLKAGILMSLESTSSRCEQLARQIQAYGRIVPIEESVARLDEVDAAQVASCAARLFATAPTLAAIGPLDRLESFDAIKARLS
jgi:predicted Zn-dependent peptidase